MCYRLVSPCAAVIRLVLFCRCLLGNESPLSRSTPPRVVPRGHRPPRFALLVICSGFGFRSRCDALSLWNVRFFKFECTLMNVLGVKKGFYSLESFGRWISSYDRISTIVLKIKWSEIARELKQSSSDRHSLVVFLDFVGAELSRTYSLLIFVAQINNTSVCWSVRNEARPSSIEVENERSRRRFHVSPRLYTASIKQL